MEDYKIDLCQKYTNPWNVKDTELKCKGALIVLKETAFNENCEIVSRANKWIFTTGKDLYDFLVKCEIPSIEENYVIDEYEMKYELEDVKDNPGGFTLHFHGLKTNWVLSVDYIRVLTSE